MIGIGIAIAIAIAIVFSGAVETDCVSDPGIDFLLLLSEQSRMRSCRIPGVVKPEGMSGDRRRVAAGSRDPLGLHPQAGAPIRVREQPAGLRSNF